MGRLPRVRRQPFPWGLPQGLTPRRAGPVLFVRALRGGHLPGGSLRRQHTRVPPLPCLLRLTFPASRERLGLSPSAGARTRRGCVQQASASPIPDPRDRVLTTPAPQAAPPRVALTRSPPSGTRAPAPPPPNPQLASGPTPGPHPAWRPHPPAQHPDAAGTPGGPGAPGHPSPPPRDRDQAMPSRPSRNTPTPRARANDTAGAARDEPTPLTSDREWDARGGAPPTSSRSSAGPRPHARGEPTPAIPVRRPYESPPPTSANCLGPTGGRHALPAWMPSASTCERASWPRAGPARAPAPETGCDEGAPAPPPPARPLSIDTSTPPPHRRASAAHQRQTHRHLTSGRASTQYPQPPPGRPPPSRSCGLPPAVASHLGKVTSGARATTRAPGLPASKARRTPGEHPLQDTPTPTAPAPAAAPPRQAALATPVATPPRLRRAATREAPQGRTSPSAARRPPGRSRAKPPPRGARPGQPSHPGPRLPEGPSRKAEPQSPPRPQTETVSRQTELGLLLYGL